MDAIAKPEEGFKKKHNDIDSYQSANFHPRYFVALTAINCAVLMDSSASNAHAAWSKWMTMLRMMVLTFISAISTPLAIAENAVSIANLASAERTVRQERYGGVVANQTMTVAGQDFYRHFVSAWSERGLSERFAISVHERPSARWGTQVWIEYAQRRIFQASLPAGRAGIRALSERAAEIALQKVADIEVERLLFRDADLGADEI